MPSKIKKKQIFIELYSYISHIMLEQNIINPCKVSISLKAFAIYLNEKIDTHLESVQHIYQQIRLFERTSFVKMFQRIETNDKKDIVLQLISCETYEDKLFLHIGFKIVLSNGALGLINELYEFEQKKRPLNIYLSAGTEAYYLAEVLFENYKHEVNIYTHNLGIIQNFSQKYMHLEHLNLFTRFGKFHKASFTILENIEDAYENVEFDFILGTTSYIDNKGLYIESKTECEYKKGVYNTLKGIKVQMLTMFEFDIPKNIKKYKYAGIEDFDYIIVMSEKYITAKRRKKLDVFPFESMIKSYAYEVLKRK